jgi:hypothetical protein
MKHLNASRSCSCEEVARLGFVLSHLASPHHPSHVLARESTVDEVLIVTTELPRNVLHASAGWSSEREQEKGRSAQRPRRSFDVDFFPPPQRRVA